jgi:hypothetical protein
VVTSISFSRCGFGRWRIDVLIRFASPENSASGGRGLSRKGNSSHLATMHPDEPLSDSPIPNLGYQSPRALRLCGWVYLVMGALSITFGILIIETAAISAFVMLGAGVTYTGLGHNVKNFPRATTLFGVVLCGVSIVSKFVPPLDLASDLPKVAIQLILLGIFFWGWRAARAAFKESA